MKLPTSLLLAIIPVSAWAQADTAFHLKPVKHAAYEPHITTATLALGFIDDYRNNYSLPAGYNKSNTTGFAPLYAKLEYAVDRHLSVAATFGYDVFQYNYTQDYVGNNGPFTRYRTNITRIVSGGVTAFYHMGDIIRVRHLDPFIGLGMALNNIRYSAAPSADTTGVQLTHTLTPYLKAGARYYITDKYSLYGDLGYDKHTIFSIGASCRFIKRKYYPDADRDGIPDYADSCINTKGIARLHGCPDSDGDGIPDNADSCPHQAGIAAFHGCPDSDGDGIPDNADLCPQQPGLAALHGCPDSDGDGIPDNEDACPHEPGLASNHGCPVKAVAPSQPQVMQKHIELPQHPIEFETGSIVLKKSCYAYMQLVVLALKDEPDADLVIDGYADITGNDRVNDKISAARAIAVKKFLVAKGIGPARIMAIGHGSKAPIATNHTRAGRARNRRATIKIKYSLDR